MIARMARSAASSSRIRIARATSSCSSMAAGFGIVGHHAVVGAAGEHLGDHAVERPEHLVAAGLQQRLVEDLVRQQVRLEVAGAAVHHHVRHRGRHDPALVRVGPPRGQRRGGRFESPPQLRERHQLGGAVAGLEPPANQPGVEDIPLLGRLDGDAHPAARFDHAHRLQHADRLAGDAARHPVLGADPVEREHLPGGYSPDTIAVPSAVSKLPCRAPTIGCDATHTSCHSFADVIKNI